MGNFDDLALAVASFGGHNKVILDDMGKPSIMVGVPKMKYSDIIAGGTQETLPWWIVEGVEKNVIWVSKYLNCVVNDRAYSLPMKDPKCYVDFDTALKYCRNKGEGWHLNQNGVFAALALWSEKNGTIPRGNTNWDASYERAWERGVNTYIDGSHGGGRTATGSGPVTWNHDHTAAGIADLCGNCWEWVSGARLVNGEIQIIPYGNAMKSDCSMSATSTEWKAIMPDGRLVEPGTAGTLKIDRTSASDATLRINTGVTTQTTDSNDTSTPFKDTKAVSGVAIPKILIAAGFFPADGQSAPGRFWARNNGERLPFRGSGFCDTSDGGVSALSLYSLRSYVNLSVSFRSAFVSSAACNAFSNSFIVFTFLSFPSSYDTIIYLRKYIFNRQSVQTYASIFVCFVYLRNTAVDDIMNHTQKGGRQVEEKEKEQKPGKPDTKNTGQQKAATKAKNTFNGKNYDRLYPFVKKGEKAKIERAATAAGQSLNDYVVTAVYQRMEREGQADGEQ